MTAPCSEAVDAARATLRSCMKAQNRAWREYLKTGSAKAFDLSTRCLDQAIDAQNLLKHWGEE